MYFNVDVRCSTSYLIIMLNKYFVTQIAENTFILHWKKVKTRISDYPSPGETEIKQNRRLFSRPTSTFSDAEMKVVWNSIVRFFKIYLRHRLKINKPGELIRLLTFGSRMSWQKVRVKILSA